MPPTTRRERGVDSLVHDDLSWPPSSEEAPNVMELERRVPDASQHEAPGHATADPRVSASDLSRDSTAELRGRQRHAGDGHHDDPPLPAFQTQPDGAREARADGGHAWRLTPERLALIVLALLVLAEGAVLVRDRMTAARPGAGLRAESQSAVGTVGRRGMDASEPGTPGSAGRAAAVLPSALRGRLTVRTEPAGARVTVDGTARGIAPVTLNDLAAGDHEVIVQAREGQVRQEVRVAAGEVVSLVVPLGEPRAPQSREGTLVVNAPIELRIFAGNRLLGTSTMERVPVAAGSLGIVLENNEVGFRQARSVTVSAGKTTTLTIELPRQRVAVNAVPWAEVWVDGVRAGETPIGSLDLPLGPHVFVFRHPNLGEKTARLLVKAGEQGRLSVNMKE